MTPQPAYRRVYLKRCHLCGATCKGKYCPDCYAPIKDAVQAQKLAADKLALDFSRPVRPQKRLPDMDYDARP